MLLGSIILAGGQSERMGEPKEGLPFGDSTLLDRACSMLMECSHPVIVVARDEKQELPPLPIEIDVHTDFESDGGPLVGLVSGMRVVESKCDAVFVTACDMPFVTPRTIAALADLLTDVDVVMPRLDDKLQPLAAVYKTSILPTAEKLVAAGERTPRALVEAVPSRVLEPADLDSLGLGREFLRNINTPEEYRDALRDAGQG